MPQNGQTEANTPRYNADVTAWGTKLLTLFRLNISALKKTAGKGTLGRSLRLKTHLDFGEIDRISYSFSRHGVFFHKGVGRGYQLIGGKVQRVPSGGKVLRNYAEVKGRGGGPQVYSQNDLKREPQEWFNPAIEKAIGQLMDIIGNYKADKAADATQIKIR
jgi:hypothetical protein